MLHTADYGVRWIAALKGLERIVDCMLGSLQFQDPRVTARNKLMQGAHPASSHLQGMCTPRSSTLHAEFR
eukprot:742231-Alexandrium_andersonii.AAC.1